MEYIIISLATAMNILIVKWKLEKGRYEDAILDGAILLGLAYVFQGSFGGLVVATISSAIISLYFIASPPVFMQGLIAKIKEEMKEEDY